MNINRLTIPFVFKNYKVLFSLGVAISTTVTSDQAKIRALAYGPNLPLDIYVDDSFKAATTE